MLTDYTRLNYTCVILLTSLALIGIVIWLYTSRLYQMIEHHWSDYEKSYELYNKLSLTCTRFYITMHNIWVIMAMLLAIIDKGDHIWPYALPLQLIVHVYLWNINDDNTLHNN